MARVRIRDQARAKYHSITPNFLHLHANLDKTRDDVTGSVF